jgi:PKD repeat protein
VEGGTIAGSGSGYVDVIWTDSIGPYRLHGTAANNILAVGGSSFLDVLVVDAPVASFGYSVNGLTVSFQDSSQRAGYHVWDFGDGITDTASNPVHVFADTGKQVITLIVGNAICSDTLVREIYVSPLPTAIASDFEAAGFRIFPNPAEDFVTLEISKGLKSDLLDYQNLRGLPIEISLLDVSGKKQWSRIVTSESTIQIERNGLPSGLYFLRISVENVRFGTKLVFE